MQPNDTGAMIFPIPIYVEEMPGADGQVERFMARPLFATTPVHFGEKLTRALTRLDNDLRQQLKVLGEMPRQDRLADWTFHPMIEERTLSLRLEVRSSHDTRPRTFFLVGYTALGRQVWSCPRVPDLFFEVLPGEDLAERAEAALTRHLRELESVGPINLDDFALAGKARLTVLEIELQPDALGLKGKKSKRTAIFGDDEKFDGARELRRTSRPLHSMYPDDLDRAIGREQQVEELARLLTGTDRRPILLVGPRRVGKTAIVHEFVWRAQAGKAERLGGRSDVWLISPMRLISGMSCLGQWENRVLAILDHARSQDQVLYFDDLLALFVAGVSDASDLTVAHVLKPTLERRDVRILAEITPESWRVLRERDRQFADQFHVIPVPEPPETETLRILTDVCRQLEESHQGRFEVDVVPTVYELHRRHAGDAAFPGKAAGFLRRLASRVRNDTITRDLALAEFQEQSGLQTALLDDCATLERVQLVEQLRRHVVGQDHVLEVFADTLVKLKARLNDPRRPLGTLLLLGPTGVGKTQSAKALAGVLFGNPERLLRLDMNEYVDGASVSRLTGTPREPEGLLTSAIRRQPFSVVLFDEIEKAAPEIFDLLMAVLDEGRLTDALGRVADFTQAVIVLTSNLGVQEARSRLGFGAADTDGTAEDQAYLSAAGKFFRPEFINRLDRIVPFRALTPGHLEGIARQLIEGVMARDGLRRRKAWLNVTSAAMNQLVALGHHPQLGARALKRVIEREVAQPVAERLAALGPDVSMMTTLDADGGVFRLKLSELAPVQRAASWADAMVLERPAGRQTAWENQVLDAAAEVLQRVGTELQSRATSGRIELAALTPSQARYFFCREQVQKVEHLIRAVERGRQAPRRRPDVVKVQNARPLKVIVRQQYSSTNPRLVRQRDAIAIRDVADELEPEQSGTVELPESPLTTLLRELVLLEAMVTAPGCEQSRLLVFRARQPGDGSIVFRMAQLHAECLGQVWGATATLLFPQFTGEELARRRHSVDPVRPIQACLFQGPDLDRLLPSGPGTILVQHPSGSTGLVAMNLFPATTEADARRHAGCLAKSIETLDADSFGPVRYVVAPNGTLEDLRTGLTLPRNATVDEFRAFWLSHFPLPRELRALTS